MGLIITKSAHEYDLVRAYAWLSAKNSWAQLFFAGGHIINRTMASAASYSKDKQESAELVMLFVGSVVFTSIIVCCLKFYLSAVVRINPDDHLNGLDTEVHEQAVSESSGSIDTSDTSTP